MDLETKTDEISNNVKEIQNEVKTKSERQLSVMELIGNVVNQFLGNFMTKSSEQITTTQNINNNIIAFKNEHVATLREGNQQLSNTFNTKFTTLTQQIGAIPQDIQTTLDVSTTTLVNTIEKQTTVLQRSLEDIKMYLSKLNVRMNEIKTEINEWFATVCRAISNIKVNVDVDIKNPSLIRFG